MPVRKICIIGLDDYPQLVDPGSPRSVGGESVQHALLARAWRDLGLDVSIIVRDHGQGRVTQVDGMRVVAAYGRSEGLPMLRFAHPRMTRLIAAMREIDADVYYQSPSAADTGVTAWFCRRHGKRSVIRIVSDLGCLPGRQLIRYWRDRRLYEYGLHNAHLLTVQSEQQRRLLQVHYRLSSEIVNMAVEWPQEAPVAKDIEVLWTANLRPVKRPEVVLELARRLPHVRFTMAGGRLPGEEACFAAIMREAQELPNVTCLGAVAYSEIGRLFTRAKLFLNTSLIEGFPNTFLQAWIRGVPVVTFFDPDRLVHTRALGVTVGTIDEMATMLDTLLRDQVRRHALGERARAFAATDFMAPQVAARYLEFLDGQGATAQIRARALRDGTNG